MLQRFQMNASRIFDNNKGWQDIFHGGPLVTILWSLNNRDTVALFLTTRFMDKENSKEGPGALICERLQQFIAKKKSKNPIAPPAPIKLKMN